MRREDQWMDQYVFDEPTGDSIRTGAEYQGEESLKMICPDLVIRRFQREVNKQE